MNASHETLLSVPAAIRWAYKEPVALAVDPPRGLYSKACRADSAPQRATVCLTASRLDLHRGARERDPLPQHQATHPASAIHGH